MNKSMNEKHVALTERIIAELESGCAPWVQPWSGPSLPYNIAGKRSYRGINVLALWTAQREFEYPTCEWLSFRQALELGGNVRKGEHGFPVFFYRVLEREDKDAKDGMRRIPMLRTYTTFNVAQCENLPARELTERHQGERLSDAEDFIAAIGAKISHGGDRAYYKHETDEIVLPDRERFESSEFYVSTVLHECAHNAESRLMPRQYNVLHEASIRSARQRGIIREIQGTRVGHHRVDIFQVLHRSMPRVLKLAP